MSKYDISLILSTYQSEKYIDACFINILDLSQRVNIQLIHIANAPSKQELSAILHFKKKLDKDGIKLKYEYFSVDRESLYCSWNRAIILSKAKVIGIHNVDDIRYPKPFKEQVFFIKRNPEVFMLSTSFYVNAPPKPLVEINVQEHRYETLISGMVVGPFFIWNKKNNFLFDEQFKVAGDFDFQIRATNHGNISNLPVNSGEYLNEGAGLSTSGLLQFIEGQVIYRRYKIVDKIIPVPKFIFHRLGYDEGRVLVSGDWHDISSYCNNIKSMQNINKTRYIKTQFNYLKWYYSIKFLVKYVLKNWGMM